ncbi:hypothetical protein HZ326_15527 [Fusarium oxysporum f. sp. albedinis]|nr:hypothetical protein HZ326_15527 [Fusarium oxysporum f. sp. albedinis]
MNPACECYTPVIPGCNHGYTHCNNPNLPHGMTGVLDAGARGHFAGHKSHHIVVWYQGYSWGFPTVTIAGQVFIVKSWNIPVNYITIMSTNPSKVNVCCFNSRALETA